MALEEEDLEIVGGIPPERALATRFTADLPNVPPPGLTLAGVKQEMADLVRVAQEMALTLKVLHQTTELLGNRLKVVERRIHALDQYAKDLRPKTEEDDPIPF